MIKTIKVKKQLQLDELIKYIFDNGIEDKTYGVTVFDNTSEVRISGAGNIKLSGYINKNTTFTVEMEELITEDTVFQDVVIIVLNGINPLPPTKYYSIRGIKRDYPTVKEIHALINGKLELIHERNEESINA